MNLAWNTVGGLGWGVERWVKSLIYD